MLAREHTQRRGASSAAVTRSVRGGVDLSPIAVPLSRWLQTQPWGLRRLLPRLSTGLLVLTEEGRWPVLLVKPSSWA